MPRRISVVVLTCMTLAGGLATFSSPAFADGDPASDVLAFDSVFNPSDSHASVQEAEKLEALVKYLDGHGYRIKIALIASAADLGTATEYWEDAIDYAGKYLGRELSLIYHGNLLVVMPEHYGFYDPVPNADIPPADTRVMDGDLAAPGSDLAGATIGVLDKLAGANGIALPRSLAISTPTTRVSSGSLGSLIGFGVGVIAVAGAWWVSLRRKPLRTRALA